MSSPEAALLEQIAKGNQDALMGLYQQYGNLVFSLALRVLREPALAEEITQDVFLKLWRQPDRWNPALGQFSSWLLTITRNAAIDRLRRENRQPNVAWDAQTEIDDYTLRTASASDQVAWFDGQLLRKLLRNLPREQAELIELAFFEGYTHSELADLLGLPLGTVKTRLRMGMQKLRLAWDEAQVEPVTSANVSAA